MVLDNQVEEPDHLLLRGIDHQVLTFGNIELEKELLLDAFDLGHKVHLVAELTYVNLVNWF